MNRKLMVVVAMLVAGCGSVVSGEEDVDVGGDTAGDTAGDVGADADADVATDVPDVAEDTADVAADEATGETEADVTEEADEGSEDGTVDPCPGGWLDTTTSLCWEEPSGLTGSLDVAEGYCTGRAAADGLPWRLPTISELRTLIRGCPSNVVGGSCRVSDSCTDWSCHSDSECLYCDTLAGPGPDGCYWPEGIDCGWYWSSTTCPDSSRAWGIAFHQGSIGTVDILCPTGACRFRCVRALL